MGKRLNVIMVTVLKGEFPVSEAGLNVYPHVSQTLSAVLPSLYPGIARLVPACDRGPWCPRAWPSWSWGTRLTSWALGETKEDAAGQVLAKPQQWSVLPATTEQP